MPSQPVWSEFVANFLRLEIGQSKVSVQLSCGSKRIVLSFPRESLESQTLQRELSLCKRGTKIALIKTDEASRPLLVRVIRRKEGEAYG